MTMAMINFSALHEHLQSLHSLPSDLLLGQEGLHFENICFAPLQCTLNMQCISLIYLKSLVSDDSFQPEGTTMDTASNSTAILIVFLLDDQHETIQHIHIGFVVCCISCTLYEQKAILPFIQSIEEDLEKTRLKQASGRDPGLAHSYSMLVTNFGGLMAIPLILPTASCILTSTAMRLHSRKRTTSKLQDILLGYGLALASATPCSSMWA